MHTLPKKQYDKNIRGSAVKGRATAICENFPNWPYIQDQARERLISGPSSEAQGADPVTFCTAEAPVFDQVSLQVKKPTEMKTA